MDWVSYKLYWVDSAWARIEALDLISFERVEILAIGTNTAPRAIAVDPINRYVKQNLMLNIAEYIQTFVIITP